MNPETKIKYQLEVAYRIKDGTYSSLSPDLLGGKMIFDDSNNLLSSPALALLISLAKSIKQNIKYLVVW